MSSFKSYTAFIHIIEQGSISGAARAMGVPRPTLSRWITELEAHLEVDLLHRSGKTTLPTRAGQALFQRVRPLMEALQDAEEDVRQLDGVPRGHLRVSLSPAAAVMLAPVLAAYASANPAVQLEVLSTNRYVDLRKEQIDVAIRGGKLTDTALICRRLIKMNAVAVAAPVYLARFGVPQAPADLAQHRCLLGYGHNLSPQRKWPLRDGTLIQVPNSFSTNDRGLLRRMAEAGSGIALLSNVVIGEAFASGRLQQVLPDTVGVTIGLYAVYARQNHLPPRTRRFIDEVVRFYAQWVPPSEQRS